MFFLLIESEKKNLSLKGKRENKEKEKKTDKRYKSIVPHTLRYYILNPSKNKTMLSTPFLANASATELTHISSWWKTTLMVEDVFTHEIKTYSFNQSLDASHSNHIHSF